MNIQIDSLSKRFNKEWIFQSLSFVISSGEKIGIIGSNGSGKSTFIKLISAADLPSKGEIKYFISNTEIDEGEIYSSINFTAPYIDLIEELSCKELIDFHLQFKAFQNGLTADSFIDLVYLKDAEHKFIKNFSSGMKQRLKLGLAICSQSELLLLDEPCSNLDTRGVELYHKLMDQYNQNRTTIIGSNEQKDELYKIEKTLRITDYK
ncbi:MAG: ABC-type multidrug transport system ATPase subunit [Vicingaceae bacterium]|jgi:ABC-type multidrug transport system ATPase subunit